MISIYDQIVIGIDQSYENTGISITADGKIKDIKSIHLDKYKQHSKKREVLRTHLNKLLQLVYPKAKQVICLVERTRIHGGQKSFININAIKAMGALTSVIVDVCAIYDVAVYSVDTRCWKSQVIGTSKPKSNRYGVPDEKWPTVQWVIRHGFEDKILEEWTGLRRSKGSWTDQHNRKWHYNNDAADSAGIAMFWFVGDHDRLEQEK